MEIDTSIVAEILNTISPFAITLGVVFATAETIFQWFIRIAFGRNNNKY